MFLFNWLDKGRPKGVSRLRHLINRWRRPGQQPVGARVKRPWYWNKDWPVVISLLIDIGVAVGVVFVVRWIYLYGFSYMKRLSSFTMPTVSLPTIPTELIGWSLVLLFSIIVIVASIAVYRKFAASNPRPANAVPPTPPSPTTAAASQTQATATVSIQQVQPAANWHWLWKIAKVAAFLLVAAIVITSIVRWYRSSDQTGETGITSSKRVFVKTIIIDHEPSDWVEVPGNYHLAADEAESLNYNVETREGVIFEGSSRPGERHRWPNTSAVRFFLTDDKAENLVILIRLWPMGTEQPPLPVIPPPPERRKPRSKEPAEPPLTPVEPPKQQEPDPRLIKPRGHIQGV